MYTRKLNSSHIRIDMTNEEAILLANLIAQGTNVLQLPEDYGRRFRNIAQYIVELVSDKEN